MIVAFGLDQELRELVEVHCYVTPGFLITLRRGPSPAMTDLRRTGGLHPVLGTNRIQVLHRVISALHAPFPGWVLRLDEQLDRLEQRVLREPTDQFEQATSCLQGGQPRGPRSERCQPCAPPVWMPSVAIRLSDVRVTVRIRDGSGSSRMPAGRSWSRSPTSTIAGRRAVDRRPLGAPRALVGAQAGRRGSGRLSKARRSRWDPAS